MTPALYTKTFSRDRALIYFQLWYWGEASDSKKWTEKKQPYQPYIVMHRAKDTVEVFYDQRGIEWCKEEIRALLKNEPQRIRQDTLKYKTGLDKYRDIIERTPALALPEFIEFCRDIRSLYPYFELAWWTVEALEEIGGDQTELEYFLDIRRKTEKASPAYHAIIMESLKAAYPRYARYACVIRLEEAESGILPEVAALEQRLAGYFYTDNEIYPASARADIERAYGIELERPGVAGVTELRGQVGYKGIARGRVRRIFSADETDAFEEGEILVATTTSPDLLPAIRKAAALVADEGGIVSHTAIVARELKKPCIIGTRFATEVFKDGDMVEVDATEGIVRKIGGT